MWVGIDASRATTPQRTGTENYARRVIAGLIERGPRHRFTLYYRDEPPPDGVPSAREAAVERRVIPFPRLWTHVRLSLELLVRRRPDVLFVPAHVLPLVHPLPSVVTVHDLGFRHFPAAHPRAQRAYLDWSTGFSAHGATHVIADSYATRGDLLRHYGVSEARVTVVYPGRDENLRPADAASVAAVRARYGLAADYVLHVGTLQPRKNLVRLIEAMRAVRARVPGISLVLAGKPGWLAAPILAQARAHAGLVRVLDYVPDGDLAALYSGARAFAFPSLYEGFGFPVLESMACATPVVCANTSSLPELAGEAALLVDPSDVSGLAQAIVRVLTDPDLSAALSARGQEQARKFSWDRCAEETLRVLDRVGEASRKKTVT